MTNVSFEGVVRYGVLWGGPGRQYLEDGPTKNKKEMIESSRERSRRSSGYPKESREGVKKRERGFIRKSKNSEVVLGVATPKSIGHRKKSSGLLLSMDQDEKNEEVYGKSNDRSLILGIAKAAKVAKAVKAAKAAIAEDRKYIEGLRSMIEAAYTIQGNLEAGKKGLGLRRKVSGRLLSLDRQDEKDEVSRESNDRRSLRKSRSKRSSIGAEDIDSGLQDVLNNAKADMAEDSKRASGGGESLESMIKAAHTSIQGDLEEAGKNGIGPRRGKSSGKLLSSFDEEKDEVSGNANDRSLWRSRSRRSTHAEDVDSGLQAVLDIAKAAIAEDRKRAASGGGESLKSMLDEAAPTFQGELDATDGKIITGDSEDDGHATSVGTPDCGRMRNGSMRNAHLNGFEDSKTSPRMSPKSVISTSEGSLYELGAYESPYEKHIRPSGRLGFSLANLESCFLPVYTSPEEDRDDSEDSTSQFSNATPEGPKSRTLLEPKEKTRSSSFLTPKTGRKGSAKVKIKKDYSKKKDSTHKDPAHSAASTMEAKQNGEIKQVQLRLSNALQTAEALAHSKLEMKSELDDLRLKCENYIASLFAHFDGASSQ